MPNRRVDHLLILNFVANQTEAQTAGQIADGTGLPRATAYRLLADLVKEGWLYCDDRPARFRPSLAVAELGIATLKRNSVRDALLPNAISLALVIRRRCMIAFYDAGDVVYTDSIEILAERIMPTLYGQRAPALTTSAGKVLVARQSIEEIERVIAAGTPRLTDRTVTDPGALLKEIATTNRLGYGVSDGEFSLVASGVSVAVEDSVGQAVAALGVTGPVPLTDSFLESVLPDLTAFASKTSIELGARNQRRFQPT